MANKTQAQKQLMKKKFFNQFYLMNGMSKNRRLPVEDQNETDDIHVAGLTPPATSKPISTQEK
jgi:hypothetical protein